MFVVFSGSWPSRHVRFTKPPCILPATWGQPCLCLAHKAVTIQNIYGCRRHHHVDSMCPLDGVTLAINLPVWSFHSLGARWRSLHIARSWGPLLMSPGQWMRCSPAIPTIHHPAWSILKGILYLKRTHTEACSDWKSRIRTLKCLCCQNA